MATIGIMNGAYFVSRQAVIEWLNDFLHLHYTRIEDTANGRLFLLPAILLLLLPPSQALHPVRCWTPCTPPQCP